MAMTTYEVTNDGGFLVIGDPAGNVPDKRYNLRKVVLLEPVLDKLTVNVYFQENKTVDIDLNKVTNQGTWSTDLAGLNIASDMISGWVDTAP